MSTRVTTHVRQSLSVTLQPSDDAGSIEHELSKEVQLGHGTGSYQADKAYRADLDVSTGGTEIDLQTVTDVFGTALGLAEVVAYYFQASEGNTAAINVTGGASNKWEAWLLATGDGVVLKPGEHAQHLAPLDGSLAVDSTHKTIKFAAASGTQSVSILIVGRSQ